MRSESYIALISGLLANACRPKLAHINQLHFLDSECIIMKTTLMKGEIEILNHDLLSRLAKTLE